MQESGRARRRLTQEARKAKTRKAILAAAARLFGRRGIEATSLEDIARAIGATKGAIYANFANKRALVDAVAERHPVRYGFAPLVQAGRPLPVRLAQVGRDVAGLGLAASRPTVLLELEYRLHGLRNPGRRKRQRTDDLAAWKDLTRRLRSVDTRRGERGALSSGDLVSVVLLLTRGVLRDRLESPAPLRPRTVEAVFRLLAGAGPSARRR
jgi:AcrR family transcriptional regulator